MVSNPPATQERQVRSLDREIPCRRALYLTPVFLPGESHGQRSLAGYNPLGRKESDMTEATEHMHKERERRKDRSRKVLSYKSDRRRVPLRFLLLSLLLHSPLPSSLPSLLLIKAQEGLYSV